MLMLGCKGSRKGVLAINSKQIFTVVFFQQEVQRRFPDGLPMLDPIEDMGIKDEGLKSVIRVSAIKASVVSLKYFI